MRGKKSPDSSGGFLADGALAQEQDEDDERDRDSDEPEKNGHGVLLGSCELATIAGFPGAIAEAATLGRGQTRAERAHQ